MEPRRSDLTKRAYRILILAAAFFLIGLFFFFRDNAPPPPEAARNFSANPPAGPDLWINPILSKYPAPDVFSKFEYDERGFNGEKTLIFRGQCRDKYLTILIFPEKFDYRKDPTKAVKNLASACSSGEDFSYELSRESFQNNPAGGYYYILADQGEQGVWYNPR